MVAKRAPPRRELDVPVSERVCVRALPLDLQSQIWQSCSDITIE